MRGQVSDEEIKFIGNADGIEIDWASQRPGHLVANRKELLRQNVLIHFVDRNGKTALFTAAVYGPENVVKDLLELTADPRLGSSRQEPLFLFLHGSFNRRITASVLKLLIEHGAEVDSQNSRGETALHKTCQIAEVIPYFI